MGGEGGASSRCRDRDRLRAGRRADEPGDRAAGARRHLADRSDEHAHRRGGSQRGAGVRRGRDHRAADRLRRRGSHRALDAGAARAVRAGRRTGRARRGGQRADGGARVPGARPHVPHVSRGEFGVGAVDDPGATRWTATTCCSATTSSRPDCRAMRAGVCSTRPAPRARGRTSTPPGTRTTSRRRPGRSYARCCRRSTCSSPTRPRRARSPAWRRATRSLPRARSRRPPAAGWWSSSARGDVSRSVPAAPSCRSRPRQRSWPTRPVRATRSTPG